MARSTCLILAILFSSAASAQFRKFSFQQPKMGSLFNLVIYSADSADAAKAAAHAYRLVDTLNEIFSDYLPQSELNRLCGQSGNGRWVRVSEPLFQILKHARFAGRCSHGRFDVTAGPLIRLWRKARLDKRLPGEDSVRAAMKKVGYRLVALNSRTRSIKLKKAGMQLDLGGIAKGETGQRVCDRLRQLGFPHSLLDAGGDVVMGSVPPGVAGWNIAINLPESEETMSVQLRLQNQAVTTSGDLYQFVELDGKRYSHIVDPTTGYAITNSRNVTVISKTGIDADWLTKACSILPVKQALRLIKRFPGTEVQVAVLANDVPMYYRSPGFSAFLHK